jgi:uncharacterized protein YkwD
MQKSYRLRFYLWLLLPVTLFSLSNTSLAASTTNTSEVGSFSTSKLVELTNKNRSELALPPLHMNSKLTTAAQMKAKDMVKNGYFSHVSPTNKKPWYWVRRANYNYSYAGENLAVLFSTPEETEEAWMDSPSHRANIMSKNYTDIGVGIATGTYEGVPTLFIVQEFASPYQD